MLFREVQRRKRIGFNHCLRFDDETTLRCRHLFPDHGLTGHKAHVASQLSGNGDLSTLGNRCFHMISLSCMRLKHNETLFRTDIFAKFNRSICGGKYR